MQRPLNILWQKENSSISNLYIDIIALKGNNDLSNTDVTGVVNSMFDGCKSPLYKKNNLLAALARERGKEFFVKGKYFDAMNTFSNGLSGAEFGTSEIGMAYANRSACFFRLNMLEECLFDIEMAKKSNYPKHLMPKLDERAAKCTSLLKDEQFKWEQFSVHEPKLSFSEHAKFAGVADCLKIQKNEKFGRHIIATNDLKIGQTVLVEKPYSILITRDYQKSRRRCLNCFKECVNLIPCKDCIGALFCNNDCMKEAFHKYECNKPGTLSRKETFELVLNMFANIDATFPDVNDLMNTVDMLLKGHDVFRLTNVAERKFGSIFQLVHNHEKQESHHLTRLRAATDVAIVTIMRHPEFKRKYNTLKYRRFLQHLILHLFHIAEHAYDLFEYTQENSDQPMQEYSLEKFAKGMYPFGCYLNHSCVPNVFCFFVDSRLICKVIRPIKKGEQLFRSYMLVLPKILNHNFLTFFQYLLQ